MYREDLSHDSEFHFVEEGQVNLSEIMAEAIGTKDNPRRHGGYVMHLDGIFAEVAPMVPGGAGPEEINMARAELQGVLGRTLVAKNFVDLVGLSHFSAENCPRLYKSAMTSGCSPDFVRGKQRTIPTIVKRSSVREAGLHFHINLPEQYWNNASMCGGWAHELSQATQLQHMIALGEVPPGYRPWYRQPGVYRPKPYGIEYRAFGIELVNHQSEHEQVLMIIDRLQAEAYKHASREVYLA